MNEPLKRDGDPHRALPYDPSERRIRSFVTRMGRLSDGQARALDTLGPRYCIPYQKAVIDLQKAFGRVAPTILEIGTGMGETTAHIAALMPEMNFVEIGRAHV